MLYAVLSLQTWSRDYCPARGVYTSPKVGWGLRPQPPLRKRPPPPYSVWFYLFFSFLNWVSICASHSLHPIPNIFLHPPNFKFLEITPRSVTWQQCPAVFYLFYSYYYIHEVFMPAAESCLFNDQSATSFSLYLFIFHWPDHKNGQFLFCQKTVMTYWYVINWPQCGSDSRMMISDSKFDRVFIINKFNRPFVFCWSYMYRLPRILRRIYVQCSFMYITTHPLYRRNVNNGLSHAYCTRIQRDTYSDKI